MVRPVPALLLSLALLALLAPPASAQDALSNGDIREVHISPPEGTRIETFRIDAASNANRREPPIGLARWITGPDPGARFGDTGAWRSELEVVLFAQDTRVVHTERVGRLRRELVFRELRERAGRTVRCVWTPDQKAISSDASFGEVRYRDFDLRGGAAFPLTLVDVVRRGGTWSGDVRVFQPLAWSFETITPVVSTMVEAGAPVRAADAAGRAGVSAADGEDAAGAVDGAGDVGGAVRVLDLWRSDGLSAGTYRFEGDVLTSFAWQAGGPVATAISADEYQRWQAFRSERADALRAAREVPEPQRD